MYSINIEAFWVCLLGFWLSYSLATFGICRTRLHWFVKFMVIAGLAGLLCFIKAPDLMLIVLAQCLTIFLMLKAGEVWRARKRSRDNFNLEKAASVRPQIGLLDVMLGMAVLGVLLTATRVDLTGFIPLVLHFVWRIVGCGCRFGLVVGKGQASLDWGADCACLYWRGDRDSENDFSPAGTRDLW